jgi:hypothetical protein
MARGHALPDPRSIRSNVAIVMLALDLVWPRQQGGALMRRTGCCKSLAGVTPDISGSAGDEDLQSHEQPELRV